MNTTAAYYLAIELMEKHGLTETGWTFKWSRGKKQFGACATKFNRRTKTFVYKEIRLSAPLTELNSEEQVTDTILHEIAHAIAGTAAGHGPEWRRVARAIGAKAERCYSSKDVNMPAHKLEVVCGCCLTVVQKRDRRMKAGRIERLIHSSCGRKSLGKIFMREAG